MLKIEKTEVVGWEAAIRGMRNPMNSWEQSDSGHCHKDLARDCVTCVHRDTGYAACTAGHFDVGPRDYDLMTRLRAAGTDHRKFMRMIEVYVDITAPLYWWKEYDTYKVGTVANSCSTMHKIHAKEFTLDDFSHEHLNCEHYHRNWIESATVDEDITSPHKVWMTPLDLLRCTIEMLNAYRESYLETKDKQDWLQMIQLLPTSYNQKRTIMLSYEVLANIYKSRRNHKLDEWHTFCDWIEGLPYSDLITGGAEYLNKTLTLPESDAIIARALSKLQSSDSPDKSKAILMELYEQLKKVEPSTPPKDFKIVDEWNQYGHVNCVEAKALRDHFDKLAEEGKR